MVGKGKERATSPFTEVQLEVTQEERVYLKGGKWKTRKEDRSLQEVADAIEEKLEAMEDARRSAAAAAEKMNRMFEVMTTLGKEALEEVQECKRMTKRLVKGNRP